MSVIEFALKRQNEEIQNGNDYLVNYWSAYLDGARAQKREDDHIKVVENFVNTMTGGNYG